MTRAELARQIDERERRAESKAAIQRALDYAARKRAEERAKIDAWLGKEPPQFVKRAGRPAKRYSFQGENLTLSEWAVRTDVDLRLLQTRIRNGWSIEQAITIPRKHSRPETKRSSHKLYSYAGRSLSLDEWSTVTGISINTLRTRLAANWSIADTLGTAPRQKRATKKVA